MNPSRLSPNTVRLPTDRPALLGAVWIGVYAMTRAMPFTASTGLALLVLALLTYLALKRRDFRGGAVVVNPVIFQLALILWLGLAWRTICTNVGVSIDGDPALPTVRAYGLLARTGLHTLLLSALFAYPLGLLGARLKWMMCFGVALGEVFLFGSSWLEPSMTAWDRSAAILDLLGLAAGLPFLVYIANLPFRSDDIERRVGVSEPPVSSPLHVPLDDEAMCRTARDSRWSVEDVPAFSFYCAKAPMRWKAIGSQLREDFTDARASWLALSGLGSFALGIHLLWPAAIALGFVRFGVYLWMLSATLRVGIAAPMRFGVVDAIDAPHPFVKSLVLARARCRDGRVFRVVGSQSLLADMLSANEAAVVAFLQGPSGTYSRVLAARSMQAPRPDPEFAT